jgi:citrate lyase subunit beta/citryl-CoA lyase
MRIKRAAPRSGTDPDGGRLTAERLLHPTEALFGAGESTPSLPVCDHYSGVEARMRKSLELQGELGPVFDVTLDCEDGAPVGGEIEHAHLVAELVTSAQNQHGRVGARALSVDHARFPDVLDILIQHAGTRLAYLMVPKPRHAADLHHACSVIDALSRTHKLTRPIPVHALVETPGALRDVVALAGHPRVESLSFGLMDFVSAHRGAIPQSAMSATGQFEHSLVVRAKLEIAAACHAHGKTPSHSVVTEFNDLGALKAAAHLAARSFGYTRMWSIHPQQIRTIVEAFAPPAAEVDLAIEILVAAQIAAWAPIRHRDTLHDRASYRYFWHVLDRAHRTGQALPAQVVERFFSTSTDQ